jgi:hypothetical protein
MSDTENIRFSAWQDAIIACELDDKTQDEQAQIFGVSPRTIYVWKQKADWDYIKSERRKLYSHPILKIDRAMLKAAETGDVNAAKVMYERFDGWTPSQNVNLGKKTDEELMAIVAAKEKEILDRASSGAPGAGAPKA